MGSLQLLNAIKAKVDAPKPEKKGRLYVTVKINGLDTHALVDTGASHNFIKVDEAKRLGLKFKEEQGWLKAVNSDAKPIYGAIRGVRLHMGDWCGQVDFSVVSMDDYPIVLGMHFFDGVKAFPIPFAESMCIMGEGSACMVPLAREVIGKAKTLSAMQLSNGLKKNEPTDLEATKVNEGTKPWSEESPGKVENLLEDSNEVISIELPKSLPPRREVDQKVELELSVKSPTMEALAITKQARSRDILAEGDHKMEFKQGKASDAEDTFRKTGLTSIISSGKPFLTLVREGLKHDPQAKVRIEDVKAGKTQGFWLKDGLLDSKGNQVLE